MRAARHLLTLLFAASALLLVACGSSEESAAPPAEPVAAKPADFPSAQGKTRQELVAGLKEGPVFAPSTSILTVGDNRFGFALFDAAQKQVEASAVAIYTSRKDGSDLQGPYPARRESFAVKSPFRSAQAAGDLANGDAFYVVGALPFETPGNRVLTALARMDGRLVAAAGFELPVHESGGPPNIGEKAIDMHTLTPADVGGDLTKLTTRIPADKDLVSTDLADVLGKKPVVLLFATPQLCASRVCGPVTDIVEQVRAESGDGVAFIHQEIYNDNKVSKGTRPQVNTYRLPTEPWLFAIDGSGKIVARFEGAFSAGELSRVVDKLKASSKS
jgi:hypothetical protein